MGRIVRTTAAADDVLQIWRYIAIEKQNLSAADNLVLRFEKIPHLLSEQPHMGSREDRYRPGMRSFSSGNYVLFYEPLPDGLRLIRVLHGARRFEDLFE